MAVKAGDVRADPEMAALKVSTKCSCSPEGLMRFSKIDMVFSRT